MRHGWVLLCAKVLCVAAAVSPTIVRPPADASLYEAYNELHVLSQKLKLPVDSPTVVVVGRQQADEAPVACSVSACSPTSVTIFYMNS